MAKSQKFKVTSPLEASELFLARLKQTDPGPEVLKVIEALELENEREAADQAS